MPSRPVSALPSALAQATVASRSCITCASGTFETTFDMISPMSVILETSPCAGVEGRRDREVALLGEAAADVLDVLVDAEDLLHDEHGREGAGPLRPRE